MWLVPPYPLGGVKANIVLYVASMKRKKKSADVGDVMTSLVV